MGIVPMAARANSSSPEVDLHALLPLLGHELRTPLTALKGQIQLMQRRLRREVGRESDLLDLERLAALTTRMNHQIDVIIDAARLTHGNLTLNTDQLDLATVIERVVGWHQSAFARHDISVELPDEPIVGWWDERLIGHIVYELVSNAIRFSPQGGRVSIRATSMDGCARVEVTDEGIGVPEAERHTVFEYGRRGTNAETYGGAGLGLYVAQGIVALHGGRLGVSPRPGKGSAFWFTLPL